MDTQTMIDASASKPSLVDAFTTGKRWVVGSSSGFGQTAVWYWAMSARLFAAAYSCTSPAKQSTLIDMAHTARRVGDHMEAHNLTRV